MNLHIFFKLFQNVYQCFNLIDINFYLFLNAQTKT